jgi:hypothetical protein
MHFEEARDRDDSRLDAELDVRLAQRVESRATRRSAIAEPPLSEELVATLRAFAESQGGRLDVVTDRQRLAAIGEVVASADKLRLLNPRLHLELMTELRWSEAEANRRKDGLDLGSLELSPTDIAAMQLLRSPEVIRALRDVGGGEGLKRATRKAVAGAAAVGLLRRPGDRSRRAYVEGGRLLQRVWLFCEANGVGLHPITGFLYWLESEALLRERFAHFDAMGAGFSEAEERDLAKVRSEFGSHFPACDGPEIAFVRFVRAPASARRSLRRELSDTLTIA